MVEVLVPGIYKYQVRAQQVSYLVRSTWYLVLAYGLSVS